MAKQEFISADSSMADKTAPTATATNEIVDQPSSIPAGPGPLPELTTNIFSQITFGWMNKLFLIGRKEPLDFKHMWKLDSRFDAQNLALSFDSEWGKVLAQHKIDEANKPQKPSGPKDTGKKGKKESKEDQEYEQGSVLRKLVWDLLFWRMMLIANVNMVSNIASVISPLFMGYLLSYVYERAYDVPGADKSDARGAALVLALFMAQIVTTLTNAHFFKMGTTEGIKMRTAFSSLIYRKTLKLSSAARQEFNSGRIMTLVSTDCSRVEMFIMFGTMGITSPLLILIIIGFLIAKIGWSALIGIVVIFATMPIQMYLFKNLSLIRRTVAPITDKRIKMTTEVFSGIRLLKFFAWEAPFLQEIEEVRRAEIAQVLKKSLFSAFAMTVAFGIPVLACGFAFVAYGAVNGGVLNAADVFPALTWFNMLRFPMMFIPNVISSWADFKVAMTRIEGMLMAPELEEQPPINPDAKHAVSVSNGEFVWEASTASGAATFAGVTKEKKTEATTIEESATVDIELTPVVTAEAPKAHLRNINLNVPKGSLVAIVGAVGSGKSSLLNAIVGEMKKTSGSVTFNAKMGYAPQTAWIQNASVKDNILFGLPYNRDRYLRAIRDCALETDLRVLQDGDQTSIGERGINLSGGQKQRVNLARLVYYNADIVLMDDPLSAVDAHVGRFLFENCILGALKDKTRILVTHQLHFLSRADRIVVMRDGEIVEQGAYQDLVAAGGEFANLIENYGSMDEKEEQVVESQETKDKNIADEKVALDKMHSDMNAKNGRNIMQVEERDTGAVNVGIWKTYVDACGGWSFAINTFILLGILQAAQVINNLWLSWWTEHLYDATFSTQGYIGVYIALGLAQCVATYVLNVYFAYACTRAAKTLHEAAAKRVIRAKTLFFDTTPLGRIMNRFSKDQDSIDNTLPDAFRMFLSTFANAIATFALIIYATPYFAVVLVPVLGVYYLIQSLYRSTSRELKRLDSISRSPLYANFGATLAGLPTIRAYGEQERFVETTDRAINENNSPYYLLVMAQRWLGVRLEALGAVLVLAAAVFGVLAYKTISPAILGLSLSYALQVTSTLSWCVRQFTDTEVAMNAVERVEYYAKDVEVEAPAIIPDNRTDKNWPATGAIEITNLEMRYAPDLPLVVKGVTFSIADKQKIGVVGRTGSGKSSLMQALYRMVEPSAGTVVIDGIDISKIGLADLRNGLAIIPQDPILFTGTFRSNLDPFSEHSDAELWDAVTRSGLKSKVSESEKGLDASVDDGGENLSVGQRQLVCLARAMVKKPKILIMDEATANVDYDTDSLIQRSLREDFADATVLTIAHRLNTIIDYDRVLVLDAGVIAEYDSPKALLSNADSKFSKMVAETGANNAEMLRNIANAQ
ncbi:P-loop containing nucleoside triphosphate hydrolase protein [Obelidium mucronatum]|nr:P-loop containing nucleoside triphosphate hydrolase protein [Obelidium mucronatum]